MKNALCLLCYNSADQLRRNWDSFLKTKYPLHVVIIDNASTDDTVELLRKSGIPVSQNTDNLGYSKAMNQCWKKALEQDVDWVFIVNPDVQCPPEWDTIVDPFTENPRCGIVGVRLVNRLGYILHSGGMITSPQLMFWPMTYQLGNGLSVIQEEAVITTRFRHRLKDCKDMEKCAWVTFATVALRSEMVREIGFLDESYFLYNSDTQYCMRAWQADWEVWYNPVTFRHEYSASVRMAGSAIQELAQQDVRRFARLEEETWLRSLGDTPPWKM